MSYLGTFTTEPLISMKHIDMSAPPDLLAEQSVATHTALILQPCSAVILVYGSCRNQCGIAPHFYTRCASLSSLQPCARYLRSRVSTPQYVGHSLLNKCGKRTRKGMDFFTICTCTGLAARGANDLWWWLGVAHGLAM